MLYYQQQKDSQCTQTKAYSTPFRTQLKIQQVKAIMILQLLIFVSIFFLKLQLQLLTYVL